MDKRKVIDAYRSGLISVQECAQILGVDNVGLIGWMRDSGSFAGAVNGGAPGVVPGSKRKIASKQSVRS